MENWVNDFLGQTQNENLSSPAQQEEFKKSMGDFKSIEDAVYGGYNARKMTGKPFKLPESVDKLDEKTRNEFTAQARKTLGIESLTEDGLKEINWGKGLAAGSEKNQAMIDEFGKFAVSKGLPKNVTQDLAEFLNGVQTKAMADFNKKTADAVRANTERSRALLESFFGTEGVKNHAELLRRAAKNQGGLSDAELEQIADELKDDVILGKGVFTKMLMNFAAKLEKEGTTEKPGGNPPIGNSQYGQDVIEDNPKTAAAVGWKK
ncbi:MAG: hypothetical protein MUO27_00900 [Sedimentisphaerales bacterium]|nr:hypothetical protein [Sedimentisphaerales bacterium]